MNQQNFIKKKLVKWYEHEEDMRKYSEKYPNIIFQLIGVGEGSGMDIDVWHKYFLNGKMQICKGEIVFDEYNKFKLE